MRTSKKTAAITHVDITAIKQKLEEIYANNPLVHVSVNEGRKHFVDVPSNITGLYPRFITVTAHVKHYQDEMFTINYIDIMIGKYKIKELEELLNNEEKGL